MDRTTVAAARRLLPLAVTFAAGLVLMGYATSSYAAYTYMQANPSVGPVSTTSGFELFTLLVFGVGAVVAFLAAGVALYRVRRDTA